MHRGLLAQKRSTLAALAAVVCLVLFSSGCYFSKEARRDRAFASGQKFLAQNQPKEAQIQFQRAVNFDPNFAMAQYLLGSTSIQVGDYPKAYRALMTAVKLRPMYFETNRDLAQILIRAKKYKEAREYAQAALKIKPGDSQAQEYLADTYAGAGDLETAAKDLEDLVEHDPTAVNATMTLASIKLRFKDVSGAEGILKTLADKNPSVRAFSALGNFYMSEGKLKEAEASLQKAANLDTKAPEPLYQLGLFYMVTNHPDQAEPIFQKLSSEHQEDPRHRGALARFHYYTGRPDKGILDMQAILKKYPDDRSTRNALVNALVETKRDTEAAELVKQVLKDTPKDPIAHLGEGIVFLRADKTAEAINDFLEVIRQEPGLAVAHYYLGMAQLRRGSTSLAKQEFGEALKYQPSDLHPRVALIELLLEEGSSEAAMELIREAPGNEALTYALRLEKARIEVVKDDLLAAEQDLNILATRMPNQAAAFANLGAIYSRRKDWRAAHDNLQRALQLDPENALAIQGLAAVFLATKQAAAGETLYKKMVADNPRSTAAALGLALVREAQNKDPEAEKGLHDFLAAVPNDAGAMKMLADLRFKAGDLKGAEELSRQIIKTHPDDPSGYNAMATLYVSQSKFPEAIQQYREVLKLSPDSGVTQNRLAWMISHHGGNLDEALALAQKSKEKAPGDPFVADTLGWIYLQKNNIHLALAEFQGAAKTLPRDQEILYHLGVAQYRDGKLHEAENSLTAALAGKPDYSGTDEARRLLNTISRR